MTRPKWITRTAKLMLWLAPGVTLMGTSCGVEFRDAAIGAGADFVGASIGAILEGLIPIDTWLASATGGGTQS